MFNSVRPHRRKPTRLPRPWDSPGKNTGVGCHFLLQCMKVKSESEVTQSCPTLSDPMDYSLPGSSIHGIFQARVLEWGAIAFSGRSVQFNSLQSLSRVWLFATPWITARQASLGLQHARLPCPSPTPEFAQTHVHWVPFSSCLQSFPASGSFPMNQLSESGGQSIGVSASTSVLPMNTRDRSSLRWIGWIFLQS